jgi:hypothetical protein
MGNYDGPLSRGIVGLKFEQQFLEVPIPMGLMGCERIDQSNRVEEGTERRQGTERWFCGSPVWTVATSVCCLPRTDLKDFIG